jgi:transposase-like protein
MPRVPSELREHILAFWRRHSEAWKLSKLTQQAYCEQQGISLKNFGNWRAQLKRIALVGPKARRGHHPRLRRTQADLRATNPAPTPVPPPGARRQFSEELKQRIVTETCQPAASASEISRRYGLDLRLLRRWRKALAIAPARRQDAECYSPPRSTSATPKSLLFIQSPARPAAARRARCDSARAALHGRAPSSQHLKFRSLYR